MPQATRREELRFFRVSRTAHAKLRPVSTWERDLSPGLYEAVITQHLDQRLRCASGLTSMTHEVDEGDLPHVLSRHVAAALEHRLRSTKNAERRVAIVNGQLDQLEATTEGVVVP